MTTNILKAISKMLEVKGDVDGVVFEARVSCAKIMLDEVIKGIEDKGDSTITYSKYPTGSAKEEMPKSIPSNKYKVIVDASGRISKIEGLPMDSDIIIDGKKMKHKLAIGKTFTEVKLI